MVSMATYMILKNGVCTDNITRISATTYSRLLNLVLKSNRAVTLQRIAPTYADI